VALVRPHSGLRKSPPGGWTPEQQIAFLRMQYSARRASYAAAYPEAEHSVLLEDGHASGCAHRLTGKRRDFFWSMWLFSRSGAVRGYGGEVLAGIGWRSYGNREAVPPDSGTRQPRRFTCISDMASFPKAKTPCILKWCFKAHNLIPSVDPLAPPVDLIPPGDLNS